MTRGPRRLKEDTDFKWETGCDLADEELVAGPFNHDRMRSKLIAAVALLPAAGVGDGVPSVRPTPATSGSAWRVAAMRPVVAALTGAVVVAGAYWLGVRAGADLPVPVTVPVAAAQHAPVAAPEQAPAPAQPAAPATVPTKLPAPSAAPEGSGAADAAPAPERAVSAPAEVVDATREAAPAAALGAPGTADAEPVQAAAPAARPSSDLLADAEAFERARDALSDGRYAQARQAFDVYLTRFPRGAMRPEAELGRLEAARGAGDIAAVEALAASLQDHPALSARRGEILRLRAEALVELGRCEEAILVSEQTSSRAAGEIRRACRARRD